VLLAHKRNSISLSSRSFWPSIVSTYVLNRTLTSFTDQISPLLATIFIVNVDNVGSNQMHQIRTALRGKGVVLMGKNTMVRRALRNILSENPQYERLLPHVKGNVGFVFTSSDLKEVRDIITANKVKAPARAGAAAPIDVVVSAGNTGMEPGKTSFFQALSIPTKIARGTIEIVSDIKVVVAGTKVGPSEATLLNMLNISPFTYGMTVAQIFSDGGAFPPSVLDIDEQELIDRFLTGIKTVACISLAVNYPTLASVSHSLVNAYKNLLAVSLETEYSFEGADKVRFIFALPTLFYYVMYKYLNTFTLKIPTASYGGRQCGRNLQGSDHFLLCHRVTTIAHLPIPFFLFFLARSIDQELTNAIPHKSINHQPNRSRSISPTPMHLPPQPLQRRLQIREQEAQPQQPQRLSRKRSPMRIW